MPSCREVTELVTDYLLDKLSRGDRLRFMLHIGMCRHCRRYLRQMKATVRTAGRLPREAIPPQVLNELMRRFEGWKR